MAKTAPPTKQPHQPTAIHKLPRLPKGTKITKRPLLHPAIASPRTGASTPKTIYISASSPFISSVKRVRKYLAEIEKRALSASGEIGRAENNGTRGKGKERETKRKEVVAGAGEGVVRSGKGAGEAGARGEEVLIKATGKAIEKALRLALYFQGQGDCRVRLRTGSVGAVDDLSRGRGRTEEGEGGVEGGVEGEMEVEGEGEREGEGEGNGDDVPKVVPAEEKEEDEDEEVTTRIRRTSMLEIGVSLR